MSKDEGYKKQNEGEGSKSGARAYNKGAKDFAEEGRVDSAAREAAESLERDQKELNEAERIGRARAAEEDPLLRGKREDLSATPETWRQAISIANKLVEKGCSEMDALRQAIDEVEAGGSDSKSTKAKSGAAQHVLFEQNAWVIRAEGADSPAARFDHLEDALRRARDLAMEQSATLCVHDPDGAIIGTYRPGQGDAVRH